MTKQTTRYVVGYKGNSLIGILGPYKNVADSDEACLTMRRIQPGRKFFSTAWIDMTESEKRALIRAECEGRV